MTTTTQSTSIDRILTVTGDYFHVTRDELMSPQRCSQRIAFARQVCMYLARKRLRWSWPKIGTAMERDHSTVIHGVWVIERAVKFQDLVSRQVGEIEERLDGR